MTKGKIMEETIHILNDQLFIHTKPRTKNHTDNEQPNQLSQNPFSKALSVQIHDTSFSSHLELGILNKPMILNLQLGQRTPFENMIKATNAHPSKTTLVRQKNKQKNQELNGKLECIYVQVQILGKRSDRKGLDHAKPCRPR